MNKNLLLFTIVAMVAILQICAWLMNKDGTIFALTSSTITGILGFLFAKTTTKIKGE